MIPIVSIVGKSGSGKTTLIEKLVPELTRRGHRVATVKHDVHGFEVDREGKDSWRHKKAGAHTVVISSPEKAALIRDVERDLNLAEIRDKLIQEVDLIL
jgi:molybdopterin-guanine dinucleotide biosynthesis protein B